MGKQKMNFHYIRSIDGWLISQDDTLFWLPRGDLKAETTSQIRAAKIRHYKRNVMQQSRYINKQKLHMQTDAFLIINRNNEKETCMFIHVAIPRGRHAIKKKAENILNTKKKLTTELQSMWKIKHKSYTNNNRAKRNHLNTIQKRHEKHRGRTRNQVIQKTATLGTASILRKVLMEKYKIFRMGNYVYCRTAVTIYTAETWLVLDV
jgi:hypothetical protein